jgi:ABC transporter DrrB family efflux protein
VTVRSVGEEPMISVEGVGKRFGDTQALAGVSLRAAPGEVVGLLDPNGAGKTTLVRILSTLLRPDAGRATVAGLDVVRDAAAVRSVIGLAGQSAALDEVLTGRENLELVGRLYGLGRRERHRRAGEVLDRLGLTDASDRRVGTYSGGMRRRLDLGATLVGRPRVLLLDEPTAGLDPRSRNDLWQFVDELAAGGATVMLTSHQLEEVERLAHRIVVIDRGRVIAEGTADALKRQVGGDVLEARLADAGDLAAGRALLAAVGDGAPQVDTAERRVSIPTAGGTAALVSAGQRLEGAGIALADLGIRHPSLDDVFFSLTGRPGADRTGDEPADVPRAEPAPGRPRPHQEAPEDDRPGGPSGAVSDTLGITRRYLTRYARTPQLLFFATVQPVLFVLGLAAVFGGLVEATEGGSYIQYLIPGVLVMNVILAAGASGVGLAEDMHAGIIDRFRSLPMARSAVLVGRTLADLARNAGAVTLMLVAGFALGFRLQGTLAQGLAAFALALLFGYAFTWVFAAVGLAVKDVQAAQFAGFAPILPLVFLSGAWVPVATMSDAVQGFARNQPVNVTIEAVRSLADGTPDAALLAKSLAWSLAILALAATLAVRQYRTATS